MKKISLNSTQSLALFMGLKTKNLKVQEAQKIHAEAQQEFLDVLKEILAEHSVGEVPPDARLIMDPKTGRPTHLEWKDPLDNPK